MAPRLFPPHSQYECKNNILSGIGLVAWSSLLWNRWNHIEWSTYWLRVIFITFLASLNTMFSILDWLFYGKAYAEAVINDSPVFILGHPRTGTTLLHNLLSQDTDQFGFANTFHCGFPGGFLTLEKYNHLLAGVIDSKRPMDNVKLSFQVPQEDELAINVLSSGTSYYMPLVFMKQEPEFRDFVSFKTATSKDRGRWCNAFTHFLKKLTVRTGDKRLLLKSPVHTGRVELLLQLFPKAQFVYIHRDPYTVFQSAKHMAATTYWYSYLNTPTDREILEFILHQYEILYNEYISARELIPKGSLCEVRFDDLESDMIGTIKRIYTKLGWGEEQFATVEPSLQKFVKPIGKKGYKKNSHAELSPELKKEVARRWAPSFKEFGYEL